MAKHGLALAASLLLTAYFMSAPCLATHDLAASAKPTKSASVLLPGAVTGVETYGPFGARRLCNPRSVALNEWQMGYVQRLIRPNDAQKQLLDELASASVNAKAAIAAACPKEQLETTDAVLSAMEKRVNALVEVMKIIRPAYARFFASLDTRRKMRLEALGPARRSWRW